MAGAIFFLIPLAGLQICAPSTFAADEICASCGQRVSIDGDFSHHKVDASVTIDGAGEVFREGINGPNFTVTAANLPAGRYAITVGEAEMQAGMAAAKKQYVVEPGDYEFLIGAASDDIQLKLPIAVTAL